MSLSLSLGAAIAPLVLALDDGLARTPPMGWRNWNAFEQDISQDIMERAMDEMVKKGPNGLSLRDVGYTDVGLDDNWQACGAGERGGYHGKDGMPIVNTKRFPNMSAMVSYGHCLNLTVGWYGNNCDCAESGFSDSEIDLHQRMDVKATIAFGFDSIKLDGCGQENNLTRWVELFQQASPKKRIMIENCHWGGDLASPDWCPYHYARTSPDVTVGKGLAAWAPVWLNMQTMGRTNGFARPGCWNYPDMLQTGNFMSKSQKPSEDRSNFGMWAIASSPLILSYNLTDNIRSSRVWDIITNQDAIAVNQAWAGDAGRLVYSWDPITTGQVFFLWSEFCDDFNDEQNGWFFDKSTKEVKFNSGDNADDDLCLGVQSNLDPAFVTLTKCSNARQAKFVYNASGQITSVGRSTFGLCLTPYSYMWSSGPGFVMNDCQPYTNHVAWGAQHFSIGVKARHNRFNHQNGYCLSVRSSAPMNSNAVQMWAKRIRGKGEAEHAFHSLTDSSHMAHIHRLMDKFDDDDGEAPLHAVLLVNADQHQINSLEFNKGVIQRIFGPDADEHERLMVSIYDIWEQTLLIRTKTMKNPFVAKVQPRDSVFLILRLTYARARSVFGGARSVLI